MNVKELIEELKKYPQEIEVRTYELCERENQGVFLINRDAPAEYARHVEIVL